MVGGFTGTDPAPGSIGLLVTRGPTSAEALVADFASRGLTVVSIAILVAGSWRMYINGAPEVVNSAFPPQLADTIAFFVRLAP